MTLKRHKVINNVDLSLGLGELKLGHVIFNDLESVIRLKFALNLIHLNELCTDLSASSMTLKRHKVINNVDLSLGLGELKAGFYLNVVKKRDFSFSLKLETLTIKVYIAKRFGRVFAIF